MVESIGQLPPEGSAPAAAGIGVNRNRSGLKRTLLNPAITLGTLSVVVLLVVWEAVVRLEIIDPIFLSSPTQILGQTVQQFIVTGSIYPHLWISLQEALLGFALAAIVGVLAGLAMGRMKTVRHLLEPYVMALYSTPTVALLPLFILWFGIGLWSKVIIVFLGGVFAILVNTMAGVEATNQRLIETARAFTATELDIFRDIVLPSSVPYVIAGVRLAIGRVLISVVVAEFYAANQGIGFLINQAGSTYKTSVLFMGILILTLTGVGLSQLLRVFETKALARYKEQ
jgi:ABC-type nitrate/sulfonate/bicarbonate transport system permease component